jgi:uncharacterized 2Fe-2S/4Fe-4S cluster protein (DUF4445 family)
LVDAAAAGLDLGLIQASGRFTKKGEDLILCDPVKLTQADIRELQLAKGAIAAGIEILLEQWGAKKSDLSHVYLAGAFGNYINRGSAQRIGLFDFAPEQVQPAGNTALLGAKLALFSADGEQGHYTDLLHRIRHISLSTDPHFQETYLEAVQFP